MNEDNDLIDGYIEGSDDALERLIVKYQRDVYTLAYRMAGDMEEAKDITQKTLIKIVGELKNFRKKSAFKTWLYRITVNTALNHMRGNKHKTVELTDSMSGSMSGPVADSISGSIASARKAPLEALIEKERRKFFRDILAAIPEKQRMAISLRVYGGLSVSETAAAMGASEGAVKANYHNGMKKLKDFFFRREGSL
jgi:RNA polymerase sigma-70 factor (ECF subfamily)